MIFEVIETRYVFKHRWSGGGGARYIVDVKSQPLIRLDAALGKAGSYAIYLQLGQAFEFIHNERSHLLIKRPMFINIRVFYFNTQQENNL
ncbi:hypothetical protein VME0621_01249 [Vibrio mediterranei]|nr:hypothetical protein VME0621_01249 [Vibrio mediterranei]